MRSFVIILCVLVCSCGEQTSPDDEIPSTTFETVYIELLDSVSVSAQGVTDSLFNPVADRILHRHNITLAQFKSTVRAYRSDPGKWKEFYESVTRSIDARDSVTSSLRQ
jgi:hypothetical protein